MWNELESYKNHFLKWQLPHLKSETINNLTQKDFAIATKKRDRCRFPTELECLHSTYFDDRSKLAYGWFALPQLMRELYSDEYLKQCRAINSLSEFLLNPMHAQRAIHEMDIVRKLYNCFMRIRLGYREEHYAEIWRILRIFQLLSNYLNGARKIARKLHFLSVMYDILLNKEKYEVLVGKILRNLTEKPQVMLEMLADTPAFSRLTDVFMKDPCAPHYSHDLWVHLSHFLEVAPERGIEGGLFELFHKRITGRLVEYHIMNMKCFAMLLCCEEGQKRFDGIDGVLLLYSILANEQLDTYEYTLLALLQGLHSKRALWRSREFMDLPEIVIGLAKDKENARQQLYCLQIIRQLGQMPCNKRFIKAVWLEELEAIVTSNELNECNRDELVLWLKREIYDSSEKN